MKWTNKAAKERREMMDRENQIEREKIKAHCSICGMELEKIHYLMPNWKPSKRKMLKRREL